MASINDLTPPRKTTTLSAESKGVGSTDPGPRIAPPPIVENCAKKTDLVTAKNPPGGILGLTAMQVKALHVQIALILSYGQYSAVDPYNKIGKYLFDTSVLVAQGYIKEDWYREFGQEGTGAAVQLLGSWTKKDGITGITDFLAAEQLQESIMYSLTTENYSALLRNNGIKSGDTPGVIMGMLFVAHVLGVSAAKTWRETGVGNDRDGTEAGLYYSYGKYAGDVIASPTGIK
jgi:hypothetical protein